MQSNILSLMSVSITSALKIFETSSVSIVMQFVRHGNRDIRIISLQLLIMELSGSLILISMFTLN